MMLLVDDDYSGNMKTLVDATCLFKRCLLVSYWCASGVCEGADFVAGDFDLLFSRASFPTYIYHK